MLGEGWEAVGDGIYRFVGASETVFARESERPADSLVDDLSPQVDDPDPGGTKRKRGLRARLNR